MSEETGTISVARDGVLSRGYDYDKLHKYLIEVLMPAPKKKPKYKNPEDAQGSEVVVKSKKKGGKKK